MKKYLLSAVVVFSSAAAYADVRVLEIRKVVVNFSEEQAKTFGNAFGLHDKLFDSVNVDPSKTLSFKAEVKGSQSNGYPVYHYTGQAVIDSTKLQMFNGKIKMTLTGQAASQLYTSLKGIKAEEGSEGATKYLVKDLSFDNFKLACIKVERGFMPYECKLQVQTAEGEE